MPIYSVRSQFADLLAQARELLGEHTEEEVHEDDLDDLKDEAAAFVAELRAHSDDYAPNAIKRVLLLQKQIAALDVDDDDFEEEFAELESELHDMAERLGVVLPEPEPDEDETRVVAPVYVRDGIAGDTRIVFDDQVTPDKLVDYALATSMYTPLGQSEFHRRNQGMSLLLAGLLGRTIRPSGGDGGGPAPSPGPGPSPGPTPGPGPGPGPGSGEDPKDDFPKDDFPKDDEPKDDEPKDDEPKDDFPKDDEPKDDEPKDDFPKDDEPKDDEPKDDFPKDDEPKDDEPKDDEPKDDKGDPKDEVGRDPAYVGGAERIRQLIDRVIPGGTAARPDLAGQLSAAGVNSPGELLTLTARGWSRNVNEGVHLRNQLVRILGADHEPALPAASELDGLVKAARRELRKSEYPVA